MKFSELPMNILQIRVCLISLVGEECVNHWLRTLQSDKDQDSIMVTRIYRLHKRWVREAAERAVAWEMQRKSQDTTLAARARLRG